MGAAYVSAGTDNVAEEVAWVVGDQPIWKSDIEEAYQNMLYEKVPINGDPYCLIPEQLAIEKLYLHQAEIDTVEISDNMVMQQVEAQINYYINSLGTKEKVEQMFRKSIPDLRESLRTVVANRGRIQEVQRKLTGDIKATPADVRRYFDRLPEDSIPYVPMQVEVQILTVAPAIPREEIDAVKARLRDYSDQVTKGERDFSTLAILYSEDPGSAGRGGELGFMGRGELVPEFAAVAFNLNDPKKVSKIVESEFGFHIIQLIEKRGDRVNVRHILLKPRVAEEAVGVVSSDKNTRNNRGVMVNDVTGSPRFEMAHLPQEVAREVSNLKPGEVSKAFIMKDPKTSQDMVAIVKLSNRIEGHRANLSDDYQQIKGLYENAKRNEVLEKWLSNKIKDTYIRIEDGWRDCEFKNSGWIKNN